MIVDKIVTQRVDKNGEVIATSEEYIQHKYGAVKKLNANIWLAGFMYLTTKICKSSNDVIMLYSIFTDLDENGLFYITPTLVSKMTDRSRSNASRLYNRLSKAGVILRAEEKPHAYMFNPMIFKMKHWANINWQEIQFRWISIMGEPVEDDILFQLGVYNTSQIPYLRKKYKPN